MDAATTLLVAACLHAGFQATVTVAVYPALVALRAADWGRGHEAHSRRMALLVVPLYAVLLAASARSVLAGPGVATWVALAGLAVAVGTTATVAAPLHSRLGREGPDPALLRRLLRADHVRCAGALLGLGGALADVAL